MSDDRGRVAIGLLHPIFAGVVLAKNLADLLGKALVTGRLRHVVAFFWLQSIRFRAPFH